jgi:hypothetical protein
MVERYRAKETDKGIAIPVGWKLIEDEWGMLWFVKE